MGFSFVDFQISLFTYKLNSQNENYIYKIKTYVYLSIYNFAI